MLSSSCALKEVYILIYEKRVCVTKNFSEISAPGSLALLYVSLWSTTYSAVSLYWQTLALHQVQDSMYIENIIMWERTDRSRQSS